MAVCYRWVEIMNQSLDMRKFMVQVIEPISKMEGKREQILNAIQFSISIGYMDRCIYRYSRQIVCHWFCSEKLLIPFLFLLVLWVIRHRDLELLENLLLDFLYKIHIFILHFRIIFKNILKILFDINSLGIEISSGYWWYPSLRYVLCIFDRYVLHFLVDHRVERSV